jgi:nitroreductase
VNVIEAIRERRSIRLFTERAPDREQIATLLDAAVCAPNHRRTHPWRFHVLGPEARHAYGLALGERRARKLDDPGKAREARDKTAAEYRAVPCIIAVGMPLNENPEIREEDYAAVMMGIQNICLAALELGLGTHIRTGAIMDDRAARAAAGVPEGERIVALINLGTPAELPPPLERPSVADCSSWLR